MKRIALLFGNNRDLKGTSKDILDFMSFLLSPQGGAWEQDEIKGYLNPTKASIEEKVKKIKEGSYDYVIVYFSGHGGCRNSTILEINPQNEHIPESLLMGLAPKQLNILDCCRSFVAGGIAIDETHEASSQDLHNQVRTEYEELVKVAADQQVRMYSCKEGESSYTLTNGQGSVYTQVLLDSAKFLLSKMDVVRTHDCHARTYQITVDVTNKQNLSQHPDIVPAKCLACLELPISFNPQCLKTI